MKVFISQPMNGKSNEDIQEGRECIIDQLRDEYGEIEAIDSFFKDAPHDAAPLWFLGKSLELLSTADVAYFADGWEDARGCRIEYTCATEYGIPTIGMIKVNGGAGSMTREQLLETAKQTVCHDRSDQYGKPEDSFSTIADFWTTYLSEKFGDTAEVDASDVANMMILLKVARQAAGPKMDNLVDIAGYAACAAEVTGE